MNSVTLDWRKIYPPDGSPPTVAEMAGAFAGGPDSVEWLRTQRGLAVDQPSSCGGLAGVQTVAAVAVGVWLAWRWLR